MATSLPSLLVTTWTQHHQELQTQHRLKTQENTVVESAGSGSRVHGFQTLAQTHIMCIITSQCVSFLIYKMGMIILSASQSCSKD